MNLVSQLLFAVVISSVTSTLLLFVWRILRRGLMLINPKLINSMLQMVCATYFLPIGYVAILLSKHRWLKGIGSSWKLYFARTKHITVVACIIAFIWLIIGGLRILKCFIQNKLWCEKLEDNIPIEDELAAEVFRKICNELNIPEGKVSLQRNPLMESPMIVCARSPQVLLPEQDYTEEELELIFIMNCRILSIMI